MGRGEGGRRLGMGMGRLGDSKLGGGWSGCRERGLVETLQDRWVLGDEKLSHVSTGDTTTRELPAPSRLQLKELLAPS